MSNVSRVNGVCHATIRIKDHIYRQQPLYVIKDLCADVIIGHDILKHHSSLELQFGGDKEPLKICSVLQASVPPASVFTNLIQHTTHRHFISPSLERRSSFYFQRDITLYLTEISATA